MASHLNACYCTHNTIPPLHRHNHKHPYSLVQFTIDSLHQSKSIKGSKPGTRTTSSIRASDSQDSYLDMWKKAMDRQRRELEFQKIIDDSDGKDSAGGFVEEERGSPEVLERKSSEFQKILEVSTGKRDRIQRMQVIDRAGAAIAAARALLEENSYPAVEVSGDLGSSRNEGSKNGDNPEIVGLQGGMQNEGMFVSRSATVGNGIPGPDFWSWTPPSDSDANDDESNVKSAPMSTHSPRKSVNIMGKEKSLDFLSIPFESKLFERNHIPPLPPLQSQLEVEKNEISSSSLGTPYWEEERELGFKFLEHSAEAAHALDRVAEVSSQGVNTDGSRWWRETGTEQRADGVLCRWTVNRGVTADKAVEWEEKYWEAADEFGYRELGSEKSGRDAAGNVWREFWKESMRQNGGLLHLEKTADKWGKNGKGDQWQEKWWEHYDASGQAEKWAHKWCSIDPSTDLEAGHAHVWHERWGEKYDGLGGSMKYTDKWAERFEGDSWTKWGDKWDEHFDLNGNGVKQGETWWEGKYEERWNRTWGEHHNGSGWVHKYGKSSSREHWDTYVEQETWYERYPHYGFFHCLENSVQLREVKKPSEWS